MDGNDQRFTRVYEQEVTFHQWAQILVDTVTGVNYLHVVGSDHAGLTVMLDADGKPIVTK